MNVKKCLKCKKVKPILEFYEDKTRKDGYQSWCKNCCREWSRNYYLKNKESCLARSKKYVQEHPENCKKNLSKSYYKHHEKNRTQKKTYYYKHKDRDRELKLKRKFNLSLDEYDKMFQEQDGCCAICGIHQSELKKALCVDHNHKTEKIRGLLCSNCNLAIGILKHNTGILHNAILYLEKTNFKNI